MLVTVKPKFKCKKLHIGRNNTHCPSLFANGRELEEVKEVEYLGDVVVGNATCEANIKVRVAKGMGIVNEIFNILDQVSFGQYYFKIALLLRESLLVNSVLYNSSVWYNLKPQDIKELEYVDKVFFSRLFNVAKTAPYESFFMETGVLNFETIIKSRRILYFHNILNRNKNQLIYSFLMTQQMTKSKYDWASQVLRDCNDFQINSSIDFLQNISVISFKEMVKLKAYEHAFKTYKRYQEKHSKMRFLYYVELKIQAYLLSPNISIEAKKIIFR